MSRVFINKISIRKKTEAALNQKRFEGLARSAANTRLIAARDMALRAFDAHVVTNELREGATATNSVLDYGNLVAFLGLEDGADAAAEVRNYLLYNFEMNDEPRFIRNRNGVSYEFTVTAPTLNEVYDRFEPPPNSYSKSWVAVIENGLGNYSYFVFRLAGLPNSRSGTGLQRKREREWIDVPKKSPQIRWVSEVIDIFLEYFSR
jgi:hypothetical protein